MSYSPYFPYPGKRHGNDCNGESHGKENRSQSSRGEYVIHAGYLGGCNWVTVEVYFYLVYSYPETSSRGVRVWGAVRLRALSLVV